MAIFHKRRSLTSKIKTLEANKGKKEERLSEELGLAFSRPLLCGCKADKGVRYTDRSPVFKITEL